MVDFMVFALEFWAFCVSHGFTFTFFLSSSSSSSTSSPLVEGTKHSFGLIGN